MKINLGVTLFKCCLKIFPYYTEFKINALVF